MTENKMKNKFDKLEWNAIMHLDHEFITFNILRDDLLDDILKLQKRAKNENKSLTYNEIRECIEKWCRWRYWSKVEYEMILGDMFEKDEEKIDVYKQVEMNLDRLTEYLVKELELMCNSRWGKVKK